MKKKKIDNSINNYIELNKYLLDIVNNTNDENIKSAKLLEIQNERLKIIAILKENILNLDNNQKDLLTDLIREQDIEISKEIEINKQLEKSVKNRKIILEYAEDFVDQVKLGLKFMMDQDKIIKQTILGLNMSLSKANDIRNSFEQTTQIIATLGGRIEDIKEIEEGFAESTGRSRDLTSSMLIDIEKIGKGTSIGIENAHKLASEFEYMGVDVKNTMEWVQSTVDISERMGINTDKVLKNVINNFKKIGTFRFKNGIDSIRDMSINAEKTRVSLESALNISENNRSLDKVIELTSQLQVMGGEFGKIDPFQFLYTSRNEPEKIIDMISDMTSGLYTFKKNSKGLFEQSISPLDVDRLSNVAKYLEISKEEIFEIAKRKSDLKNMDKQLIGLGLNKAQKDLITGSAFYEQQTGKYYVMINGHVKYLEDLNESQIGLFVEEKKTLEERAKLSQTFSDTLENTIYGLKSGLIPILRPINSLLEGLRPIFDAIATLGTGMSLATLLAAGLAFKVGSTMFKASLTNFIENGKFSMRNTVSSGSKPSIVNSGSKPSSKPNINNVGNPNAGLGMMRGGIGIGAAALGIGAGIGIAATGVSKLADSMNKLDTEKAKVLNDIVFNLGLFSTIGIGIAAAISMIGVSSTMSASGLLIFAGATAIVGVGIAGIGYGISSVNNSMANLIDKASKSSDSFKNISSGILGLSLSLSSFSLSTIGLPSFIIAVNEISNLGGSLNSVATSFALIDKSINNLKTSSSDLEKIQSLITNINNIDSNQINKLSDIFKSPLKVELSESSSKIRNDITLEIDGKVIFNKIYDSNVVKNVEKYTRNGKGSYKV